MRSEQLFANDGRDVDRRRAQEDAAAARLEEVDERGIGRAQQEAQIDRALPRRGARSRARPRCPRGLRLAPLRPRPASSSLRGRRAPSAAPGRRRRCRRTSPGRRAAVLRRCVRACGAPWPGCRRTSARDRDTRCRRAPAVAVGVVDRAAIAAAARCRARARRDGSCSPTCRSTAWRRLRAGAPRRAPAAGSPESPRRTSSDGRRRRRRADDD